MIKVGLIGYGYWGEIYARILSEMKNVSLDWICDLERKHLSIAKKKYSSNVTEDYQEVLGDPCVQGVVVCTPLSTHYDIVRDSLKAGKHVLVEKPFVQSAGEAEKLIKLAGKKDLVLVVGYTFLFHDYFRKLVKLVRRGVLGDLRFITSVRTNLGPVRHDANAIWDLAPHDFSMILEIVGDYPKEVSAFGAFYLRKGVVDVGFVTLKFNRNVIANTTVSWLSPLKNRQFMVVGSKRMAVFDDSKNNGKLIVYDKGVTVPPRGLAFDEFVEFGVHRGKKEVIKIDMEEPLVKVVNSFLAGIGGKPTISSGLTGKRVVRILEACDKSIKIQRPVLIKT